MPKMVITVAAGGAAGAALRYLAMVAVGRVLGAGFPYGTLVVNILGCLALGALIEIMALSWSVGLELRAFLVVGVLGGFTTFSAFAMDSVYLAERGQLLAAGLYMASSVVVSIAAFLAGLMALRAILT